MDSYRVMGEMDKKQFSGQFRKHESVLERQH